MRLFDVATVIEKSGHWPNEGDSRACSVTMTEGEVCDPADPTITVITGTGDGDTYSFNPFYIEATLPRRTWCVRDDDDTWLAQQLRDGSEQAVLKALVTAPYTGAVTGFYNATGMAGGTLSAVSTQLVALREAFAASMVTKVGEYPIVFVHVLDLADLYAAHLLVDKDSVTPQTVWGDPVIFLPDNASQGDLYLTGPITVYLSPSESIEGNEVRGNRIENMAVRQAAIDVAPCTIGKYNQTA